MLERLRTGLWDPEHPRELVFAGLAIVTVVAAPDAARTWATAAVLLAAFVGYLVLTRGPQRYGPAAFLICTGGGVASILLAPNGVGEWPVLMCAVYCRVTFRGRTGVVVTGLLAVGFAFCIVWISSSAVGVLAGLGVPVLAQRRLDQEQLHAERDRALALLAELEAARDAQTQAAALEERGRIAREMHDVLAHSLAGLSLQLQAVRAVAGREGVGPQVLEPLDRAAELARSGVEEAKAAVGALREMPSLGLADLPVLIERFPGSATYASTGTPAPVDPALGHALYRAVQESLTNSARYAPGSPVRVGVHWEAQRLVVRVEDDGPGDHPVVSGQGTGEGLRGMRERLAAAGAELGAGPWQHGWRTEVTVPLANPS
ncbi:MAG TPA: histidine kinase [Frankiaceae bacterium]|nr:histidine kinase [Frankiaceae bacterium]